MKNNNRCPVLEENSFFIGKSGDCARTSPLLECAGLFIYDENRRQGMLIHWQDATIRDEAHLALEKLKLGDPYVVLRGCGVPVECLSLEESRVYQEVSKFLKEEHLPVRSQRVGFDCRFQFSVNFSNGVYRARRV